MPGTHLYTWADPPNPRHLDEIVDALRHDGVIALSMGTNWAFAAAPTSKQGVQQLRRLKPDHDESRPFSLLCSSISMATDMAVIDAQAYRLLHRLWPGPFTVLLPSGRGLPRLLKVKRKVVGVRIPDDTLARTIADHFGGPLVVTTVPAGPDGRAPTLGYEVHEHYGQGVDLVVDLGEELPGTETTVLDLTGDTLEVIREGAGDLSAL